MSVYRIPAKFGMDWLECGSWEEVGAARLVRDCGSTIEVEADDAAMGDLVSRADLYVDFDGDDYRENRALCQSALRTYDTFPGALRLRFLAAYREAAARAT